MRAKMLAHSKLDPQNASGTSAGHKGNLFKLAGGRWNPKNPTEEAIFGGAQGKAGRFLWYRYSPASALDLLCEAWAGPHDYLNSYYLYDSMGNQKIMSISETYIGELIGGVNLFAAAPFVIADSTTLLLTSTLLPNYGTYMKISTILIIVILLEISGCLSMETKKEFFVNARNYDLGRSPKKLPLPIPVKIINLDAQHNRIEYEYDTGCKWYYIVDTETDIIIFWNYISDPDLCYHNLTLKQ